MMQSKKPKARGKWGDGKEFSFPTVLPPQHFYKGKQNHNSSVAFSGNLWSGEERRRSFRLFTHQTTQFIFTCHHLICLSVLQAVSKSKNYREQSTDPESNNPRGTCPAFLEITVREKNYLLRATIWSTNTFSFPQQLGYCRNRKYVIFFLKLYLIPELM